MDKSRSFEEFVGKYFQSKGYELNFTPRTGDYGVDIFAVNEKHKIAVQVKMYGGTARKINRKCIMELHGAKDFFDCDMAVIATNGEVLNDATEVAKKLNIEILNLKFDYKEKNSSIESNSFESIWINYIHPLEGKELFREDGSKNVILRVDSSGVKRITSNGKTNFIGIEIFRETYSILLQVGQVSRDYTNQNYTGRASSSVILILAQVPFIECGKKPSRLVFKEDTTSYLLKSPNNSARLLKSINDYKLGLGHERNLIED